MARAYVDQINDFPVAVKYEIFQHLIKDEALKAYRAMCRDVERLQQDKRRAAQGRHIQESRERKPERRGRTRRPAAMTMKEFLDAATDAR